MRSLPVLVVFFVLGAWLLPGGEAIYADQMGTADWHRAGLGSVTAAVFDEQSGRLVVGTQQGVIAALRLTDGEIVWRRRLAMAAAGTSTSDEVLSMHAESDKLVVLSGARHLRASVWQRASGELLWESAAWNASSSRGRIELHDTSEQRYLDARLVPDQNGDKHSDVLVAVDRVGLLLRSGRTGQTLWRSNPCTTDDSDAGRLVHVHRPADRRHIVVAVCRSSSADSVQLVDVELSTGQPESLRRVDALQADNAVFLADQLVAVDQPGRALVVAAYGPSASGPSRLDMTTIDQFADVSGATVFVQTGGRRGSGGSVFVLRLPGERLDVVCSVDQRGQVTAVGFHPLAATSGGDDDAPLPVYFCSQQGGAELLLSTGQELAYADSACDASDVVTPRTLRFRSVQHERDGAEPLEIELQLPRQPGIRRVHFFGAAKTADVYTLLVRNDESVLLYRAATLLWQRDEALATGSKAVFVDLPRAAATSSRAELARLEDGLLSRLLLHVQQLGVDVGVDDEQYHQQQQQQQQVSALISDAFGFRKLLLLLTRAGRVFAFDSASGAVLWSVYYPCAELDDIAVDRHAARALVLLHSRRQRQYSLSVLDVLAMASAPLELARLDVDYAAASLSTVPRLLSDAVALPDDAAVLLIDRTQHVCHRVVVGDAPQLRSVAEADVVHVVVGDSYLQGYTCSGRPVWQRRFDGDASGGSETIVATALFPDFSVGSPIKIFGNGSIAGKYINPNKIVVATTSAYATAANKRETVLNVYVIDTVVGLELLHYSHRYGDGPVHVQQADNWLGYQYWHTQAGRFEFVSVELFYPNGASSNAAAFSSHDRVVPTAVSAAFVAAQPLGALAASKSTFGITPRHVIWTAWGSRVVAIDGRLLDPRRPVGPPTDDDRAEELLPYYPELMQTARGQLSYNLSLFGLDHLETHPANIESTTLVFAFGVDVFFGRYAPAQQFDVLQEEFNKPLLLLTVAIVVLLGAFTKLLNRRKLRNFYWD